MAAEKNQTRHSGFDVPTYGTVYPKGTKKSVVAKEIIKKWSRDFGGLMTDPECMRQAGISRNSYYKYKKELMEEE